MFVAALNRLHVSTPDLTVYFSPSRSGFGDTRGVAVGGTTTESWGMGENDKMSKANSSFETIRFPLNFLNK